MKILNIFFYLVFTFYSTFSNAQITFEKAYKGLNYPEIARSCAEDGRGGYIIGTSDKDNYFSLLQTREHALLHLNGYGDTLWYSKFTMSHHASINIVRKAKDGGYYAAGIAEDTSMIGTNAWWINKFDTLGKLKWSKYYEGYNFGSFYTNTTMDINDAGNILINNGYGILIDTGGVLISISKTHSKYLNYAAFPAKAIAIKGDSIYYYDSYYHYGLGPNDYSPKILKLKHNGDTIGSVRIYSDTGMGGNIFKKIGDDFLLYGWYRGNSTTKPLYFLRVDSIGNTVFLKKIAWHKNILDGAMSNTTIPLQNGRNIICSRVDYDLVTPPLIYKGHIFCFDDFGDSLWLRSVPSDTSYRSELYDVIATSDSCVLACGQIYKTGTGIQKAYIVKLDSNGNLYNPLSVVVRKKETYLHLYPNPAASSTSIHYMGVEKNATLSIFNLQGQLVYSQILQNMEERVTLNTQQLGAGFYLCNINLNNKILASKKLVVIKD